MRMSRWPLALGGVLLAGLLSHPQAAPAQAATTQSPAAEQPAAAACSRTWVGHEPEFEAALRTSKVIKLEEIPIGVTKPQRATLEPSTPVASFAWKPIRPGRPNGYFESYKSEIAAYELDKMLDLHMVPPNVERKHQGLTGAAVYWIENTKGWNMKQPPQGPEPQWSRQLARMKMFDLLIANIDRNQGNLLYDADWHLFLIDHSRAFIDKKDLKGLPTLATVDRALWGKITALTFDQLKATLGPWVGDGELRAMLARRDLMAAAIQKLVAERGEDVVFF